MCLADLPPRMARAVPTVLCLRCATLLTLVCCVHSVLCSITVCSMCVCLCVRPEVVAGKGQEPVETQIGGMVIDGNTW